MEHSSDMQARAFVNEARAYLTQDYLPKIERCLEKLSDEQIWWRPNEQSNSIGNLILHLIGNATQWIISGVGGADDIRRRDEEFAERRTIPRDELIERLRGTIQQVDAVIADVDVSRLLETGTIQGKESTLLHAIYQVTEHFALHTGQIIYITKLLTKQSMAFYEFIDGVPYGRWMNEGGTR